MIIRKYSYVVRTRQKIGVCMQTYCRAVCTSLTNYCEKAQQTILTTILEINEIRLDPEGFQRICLVALSILQGINYYCERPYLPQLVAILDISNTLDFYGFLKIPYQLFHAIDSNKIDEFRTQKQLEHQLCLNWGIGQENEEGLKQNSTIHDFSQASLRTFLKQMSAYDLAWIDDKEFSQVLQKWMVGELTAQPDHLLNGCTAHQIDLQKLKVIQKENTWLENLTDLTFLTVDVICVPTFLRDLNLLELASYANSLGRFKLFSWVPGQSLDTWVRGGLCIGFFVRFLETCRTLKYDRLGESTKKRAYWELAVSITEFAFNISAFSQVREPVVIFLTFIAKSIGIASLAYRPSPHFFENHST